MTGNGNKNNGKPDYHLMGVIIWVIVGWVVAFVLGAVVVYYYVIATGVTP